MSLSRFHPRPCALVARFASDTGHRRDEGQVAQRAAWEALNKEAA